MRGVSKISAVVTATLGVGAVAAGIGLSGPAVAHDTKHVDLEGVWMAFAVEPSARLGGLTAKLTDAGKAAVQKFKDETGADAPEAGWYCVGTGMPYMMPSLASYPITIVQSPGFTLMVSENENQIRRIYTDGRDFPEDYPETRAGYSIGRWDGKTFVVDTQNFKEWPQGGAPRSEQMTITERFTLSTQDKVDAKASGFVAAVPAKDDRVLIDHMTITDPLFYTEPLNVTVYFQPITDDNTLEYDCPVSLWQQALDEYKAEKGAEKGKD